MTAQGAIDVGRKASLICTRQIFQRSLYVGFEPYGDGVQFRSIHCFHALVAVQRSKAYDENRQATPRAALLSTLFAVLKALDAP
jgi:hypothetical protein